MSADRVHVRLLFVDEGSYHHEVVTLPSEAVARHDRLIDCVREDSEVLARLHVDVDRLCSAVLLDEEPEA